MDIIFRMDKEREGLRSFDQRHQWWVWEERKGIFGLFMREKEDKSGLLSPLTHEPLLMMRRMMLMILGEHQHHQQVLSSVYYTTDCDMMREERMHLWMYISNSNNVRMNLSSSPDVHSLLSKHIRSRMTIFQNHLLHQCPVASSFSISFSPNLFFISITITTTTDPLSLSLYLSPSSSLRIDIINVMMIPSGAQKSNWNPRTKWNDSRDRLLWVGLDFFPFFSGGSITW